MLFRRSPPQCPIPQDDRRWIERRMTWLCDQFGRDRLQFGTIVLPTEQFFPEPYEPTEEGVQTLLRRTTDYMGVDPRRVEVAFFSQRRPIAFNAELIDPHSGAAGIHDEQSGKITTWLEIDHLGDPANVVATLAHELGHVHLLGDKRLTGDEPDHEPLTDLITVFLGLGVFTANAVLRDRSWTSGGWTGFQIRQQGYLTARLFGYALALCAWCRQEESPAWRKYLRPDVRSVLDQSLKFLEQSGAPRFPNCHTGPAVPPGAFPAQSAAAEPSADEALEEHALEEQALEEQALEAAPCRDPAKATGERPADDDDYQDDGAEAEEADDPDLAAADECFQRALIHYQAGAFAEAIAEATEAIERSPGDGEFHTLRARAYLGLERYRDALEDAERAVELDEDDADARRARGVALVNAGQPARALEDFDFLLEEDRHDAEAYYYRGLAYAALGKLRRAVADYSQAIVKAPNMVETYFARHQAYKDLGEVGKAQADLKEGQWRRSRLVRE